MAYDEGLAERLRECFSERRDVVEKKMFGGLCFMVDGHMCCGIVGDRLMARVGPDQYPQARSLSHASEMDFTGRSMKGFLYVAPEGLEDDKDLAGWVSRCERFVATQPKKQTKAKRKKK